MDKSETAENGAKPNTALSVLSTPTKSSEIISRRKNLRTYEGLKVSGDINLFHRSRWTEQKLLTEQADKEQHHNQNLATKNLEAPHGVLYTELVRNIRCCRQWSARLPLQNPLC